MILQSKEWYKSKTIWAAVGFLAVAFLQFYNVALPYEQIIMALSALGLYGVRDAIDK